MGCRRIAVVAWTWAAAASRGVSHERNGLPLQDALSCFSRRVAEDDFLVATVSDGAGSASHGGKGAVLVCRSIALAAREYLSTDSLLPSDETVERWLDDVRDRIYYASKQRGLTPRDFAATLVSAISSGDSTLIIHVGDGCAVVREAQSSRWTAPTWPDQGEYASTTSFVTDEGPLRLRVSRCEAPIDAIALFSDGIERLALDFLGKQPFTPFFARVVEPVFESSCTGRDRTLSEQLRRYLSSPAVNERTDDDKSLILAVRK